MELSKGAPSGRSVGGVTPLLTHTRTHSHHTHTHTPFFGNLSGF